MMSPIAPPSLLTLDGLMRALALIERAADEASLTDFKARKCPDVAHDVLEALRIIERINGRMGAIKELLETLSGIHPPRDRIQATFDEELAMGRLLESAEFQQKAGWTRQALSKAVIARRVFFLELAGARAYPAFYLDARYNRKDVEAVTKLLGDLSGGSKWLFFTTPKGSLARSSNHAMRTPLEAMEDGDLELVKRTAAAQSHR